MVYPSSMFASAGSPVGSIWKKWSMNDSQVAPAASAAAPTSASSPAMAVVPPSMSKMGTWNPRSMTAYKASAVTGIPRAGRKSVERLRDVIRPISGSHPVHRRITLEGTGDHHVGFEFGEQAQAVGE